MQRGGEIVGADLGEARLAGQIGREPVRRGGERGVGKIGPVGGLGAAQKHHAVAPLFERLRPRQPLDARAPARRAASASAARRAAGSVCSLNTSAPSRRRRRARKAAAPRSKAISSEVSIWSPAISPISSGVSGAAARMRAEAARPVISPIASAGSARQRVVRLERGGAAVRHQELAALAAR